MTRLTGGAVATVQDCRAALDELAARLAEREVAARPRGFERTLSCTTREPDAVFAGRLHEGLLVDIEQVDSASAQIGLELTGDDLVELIAGQLNLASAWATGRVKVHAGMRDMMKLRSIF